MKTAIDDALERLRGTGPEVEDAGPNHGPMAAEALVSLGCDAMVPHWVDQYRRQLSPMPEATKPLTVETWPAALGVQGRVGDWMAFFCRQLAEAPWPAVLAAWVCTDCRCLWAISPIASGAARSCWVASS